MILVVVLFYPTEIIKFFGVHTVVFSLRLAALRYNDRLHCVFTNHSPHVGGIINHLNVVSFEIGKRICVVLIRGGAQE